MAKKVDSASLPTVHPMVSSHSPIGWFVVLAICIHAIGLSWFLAQPHLQVAVLPDWMNVVIKAGFEEVPPPAIQPIVNEPVKPKPEQMPVPVTEKIKTPIKKTVEKKPAEQTAKDKRDDKKQPEAKPQTYVQANSQPFDISNPKPLYPVSARKRGIQGKVLLQLSITAEGKVAAVHVMQSSGFRMLDLSAVNSVKRWRFMPALQDGQAVASVLQVPIRFVLKE